MKIMKKRFLLAALLCLTLLFALATPAYALYPAGIDESLPRVIDNDLLFLYSEKAALEEKILALCEKYKMDIVILTESSIGNKAPHLYNADFFDYGGYGWREEETGDITTGRGVILLLVNMHADSNRRMEITDKPAHVVGIVDDMLDNMQPLLVNKKFYAACETFLRDVEKRFQRYLAGEAYPTYAEGYTEVYDDPKDDPSYYHYGDDDYDYYGSGTYFSFNGGVFVVGLLISALIGWIAVSSMKKKMNTARKKREAGDYMRAGSFRLSQQQDNFLYSKTTKVKIETSSSGGGGGSSGGGSFTSSSGSSHSGGGRSF